MADHATAADETDSGGRAGLCATCRHHRAQPTRRGTVFSRCQRADVDPDYLRYPPLPVRVCPGFERAISDRG
ncbi:MAG TPA: hypothetical protein PLW10_00410 [Myxococcota bacterium]|nr:hypothetical protein [Myxococcota bacterium]